MKGNYIFRRIIERPVNEARICDPKLEGHYADICREIEDISHFLDLRRDDDETIREIRYYVPGILTQTSVKIEFNNRTTNQVEALAFVHTTGLVQRLNTQLAKKLTKLGYSREY